jgi:hypothetical protein
MTFSKLTLIVCCVAGVCVRCENLAGVENSKEFECECEYYFILSI